MERRGHGCIKKWRVRGGGPRSVAALTQPADIFGLPATRPHTPETSGLGAAIDAAVGVGLFSDFGSAVAHMTHRGQVFEPNPVAQATYNHLYERVYLRMYSALRRLYAEIQEITGYPEPIDS